MKKLLLALIIIPALMMTFQSCEEEASDYFNFQIISTDQNFGGYYIIDGKKLVEITEGTQLSTGSRFYQYQTSLDNPDSIKIVATADSNTATSMSIYIYQNEEMVADVTENKIDDNTITVELSHSFDKGDDDDDSSD